MGHLAQANAAQAKIPIISARTSANLATITVTRRELLRLLHFCDPSNGGHCSSLFLKIQLAPLLPESWPLQARVCGKACPSAPKILSLRRLVGHTLYETVAARR